MALLQHTEPAQHRGALRDDLSGVFARYPSEPPPPPSDSLVDAAVDAVASGSAADLPALWQDLLDRRLDVYSAGASLDRHLVIAGGEAVPDGRLGRLETAVLVRVLCGEQQKLIASELGIACSTTSKWYTQGLDKLRLRHQPVPLPLIVAAQAWASGRGPALGSAVAARSAVFRHAGRSLVVYSVPTPRVDDARLTRSEREVAHLLIEGLSRWEIARKRATSAQTVACQLRGLYSKLRVSGRNALVWRGVELGWFA